MKEISAGMNSEKLISVIFQQKGMEATVASIKKFEAALNTASQSGAKIQKVTDKFKDTAGNVRTVTSASKDYGNTWAITSDKIKLAGEQTAKVTQKSNDFINALKRAAIVAPVWMALRGAMQGVISTVTEGFDAMVKFDTELLRIKSTLSGTFDSKNTQLDSFKKDIENLSKTTGVSMDKIANMMYKFTTLGLSKNVAVAGTTQAIDTARALLGNPEELAKTWATSYKVLGDSFDQTLPPMEQFKRLGASTIELFKANAFEIDGMSDALDNFIATAGTSNITVRDATALLGSLSTAAMKASSSGRLLSTFIMKFGQEHIKAGEMLGIKDLNLETDGYIKTLMKFMDTLKKADLYTQIDVFKELGGTRNTQALRAFLSAYDTVIASVKTMNPTLAEQNLQLQNMSVQVGAVNDGFKVQLERTATLKAQLGKSFIEGIFGTPDDIKATTIALNDFLEKANKGLQALGLTLAVGVNGAQGIGEWLGANLLYNENMTKGIDQGSVKLGKGITEEKLQKIRNAEAIKALKLQLEKNKAQEKTKEQIEKEHEASRKITEEYKKQNGVLSAKEKRQQKLTEESSKYYQKIAGLFGASDVQKAALDYLYSVEMKTNDLLEKRRTLELAITEQKLKQSYYGSDTMKLYEIALKYGPKMAEDINKYLKDTPGSRESLKNNSNLSSIFKENFSDRFQQQSAYDYFNKGPGKGIVNPTEEGGFANLPKITANEAFVNNLNVNMAAEMKITINGQQFDAIVEESAVRKLDNINSKLSKRLNKSMENF